MKKLIPFVFLLASCGGDYKNPESAGQTIFSGQKVKTISGDLQFGGSISGTGSVIFESEMDSFDSGKSYALDFSLQEGGCVELVSHSNELLESGWEMRFCREGTGVGSLKATIFAGGERRDTKKNETVEAFGGFDGSTPLKLQIDVHNNEDPTHALVWSRAISEDFSESAAVFNSEEFDNSPGRGKGKRWGLRLNKASVSRIEISNPKFSE